MREKRCPARRSRNSPVNASSRGRHQPRRRLAVARRQASSPSSTSAAASSSSPSGGRLPGSSSNDNTGTSDRSSNASGGGSSSSDEEESTSSSYSSSSAAAAAASSSSGSIAKSKKREKTEAAEDEEGDAMQTKLDWKLVSLYTLLVLQILVVMLYVASMPHVSDLNTPAALRDTVSFVENEIPQLAFNQNRTMSATTTAGAADKQLRTIGTETTLRESKTFRNFQAYNTTLCWRAGVDDRRMRRELVDTGYSVLDRCACLPGWHGSDCGQPEVVWRAIMASKQNVQLSRRKLARRLIHTFYVHDYNTAIVEVIVEELYPVVDLFVICDFSLAEDNFRHKLAKGFLGKQQDKILYLNVAPKAKKSARVISKYVWERVKKVVRNLRDDDIYATADAEQILNGRALMFLKTYDGWPQPIGFRLRWSVFGFFWQHPSRTLISLGASSLGLVHDANAAPASTLDAGLSSNEVMEQPQRDSLGLVIGDLNHYGGWYCQFCQGPANIIAALREKNRTRELVLERSVDVPFVEDLIGSGTWFDEKTSLLRAYRSRDAYYAPETVLNNTWKYDWLVENFYAKLDYY